MYKVENPIVFDNLNEYFVRAKSGEAELYFARFLCCYEPTLDRRVGQFLKQYSLGSDRADDLKQIFASMLWDKLKDYTADNPVPFLQIVKFDILHAWHEYIRITYGVTVVTSEKMYSHIRKAAQIYYSVKNGTWEEKIAAVAKELNLPDTKNARILMQYAEQFRFSFGIGFSENDEDSNDNTVSEDKLSESCLSAEDEYFRFLRRQLIRDAADALSHNDLQILALTTGVCLFCFGYIPKNEWRTYE